MKNGLKDFLVFSTGFSDIKIKKRLLVFVFRCFLPYKGVIIIIVKHRSFPLFLMVKSPFFFYFYEMNLSAINYLNIY